jgi:hypothetical protein
MLVQYACLGLQQGGCARPAVVLVWTSNQVGAPTWAFTNNIQACNNPTIPLLNPDANSTMTKTHHWVMQLWQLLAARGIDTMDAAKCHHSCTADSPQLSSDRAACSSDAHSALCRIGQPSTYLCNSR